MLPKISIVTPVYNLVDFIEQTILSVVDQAYPNLEYIVIDGGSSDGTTEIIERYKDRISVIISEKDQGQYFALQRGMELSTGEIMGWINGDDILWPGSLNYIANKFSEQKEIQWIQGYPNVINNDGQVIYERDPVYTKEFFLTRSYHDGRFIQQESTFWSRKLWDQAGGFINTDYRYAADFELWVRFFQYESLFLTKQRLGSFRDRGEEQVSRQYFSRYLQECDDAIDSLDVHEPTSVLSMILKIFKRKEEYQEPLPVYVS